MERNGKHCGMCGTDLFDWQTEEYDVIASLCPECTMEFRDYFPDLSEEESVQMANML